MRVFSLHIRGRFFSTTSIHQLLSKDSDVTRIRIWKSGYFDANRQFVHTNVVASFASAFKPGRQPNIGHVSIETKDLYASLWPDRIDVYNKLKPQIGHVETSSPFNDEETERKAPDVLVDLRTLDVTKIQQEIMRFVESGSTYHLIGRNRFFKSFAANSCSGLAYDLLHKGGIQQLVLKRHVVRDYFITTPNNLVALVLEAQAKEKEILDGQSKTPPAPPSNRR